MKTIEITDEMYDSLMELSKEMTTQDNLCTAMPHMFQIRTMEKCAAYPGQDSEIWVSTEGEELETEEEIRKFIKEHICENSSQDPESVDSMDRWDIETYMDEETSDDWWKVNQTTTEKYQNTFFTAKACKEHIKANNYHYAEPTCYLNHAFRNPEMELVSKFLCELSGGNLHV